MIRPLYKPVFSEDTLPKENGVDNNQQQNGTTENRRNSGGSFSKLDNSPFQTRPRAASTSTTNNINNSGNNNNNNNNKNSNSNSNNSNNSNTRPESSIKGVVSQRVHQYSTLQTPHSPSLSTSPSSPSSLTTLSLSSSPTKNTEPTAVSSPSPVKPITKHEPIPTEPTPSSSSSSSSSSSYTTTTTTTTTTKSIPIPAPFKRATLNKPTNDSSNTNRNFSRNGNQTRSTTIFASTTRKTPISLPRQPAIPTTSTPKTMISSTPAYYRSSGMTNRNNNNNYTQPIKPTNKLTGSIPPRSNKVFYETTKRFENSSSSTSPSVISSSAPSYSYSYSSPTSQHNQPLNSGSPRTGARHVHELAQQFNGTSRTPAVSIPSLPIPSTTNTNNSNGTDNISIVSNNITTNNDNTSVNPPDTVIQTPVASAAKDIPQSSRRAAGRSLKRPQAVRQTPAHTHSVDIFFPLPNSPLMDRRRSRKRSQQQAVTQALLHAQGIANQRRPGTLDRSQSCPEVNTLISQPTRTRSNSGPPFPHNEQIKGLIPRPASLKIPKKSPRRVSHPYISSNPTPFFRAIQPSRRGPSTFNLLQDYRSPPSSTSFPSSPPPLFIAASPPPAESASLASPPISPRSSESSTPSPPSSPTSTSPPIISTSPLTLSTSPLTVSPSPPTDPTCWTKAAPVPPPMPKLRHSSKSSLRLSRKTPIGPLYNSVAVLGSEIKHDFKRSKPYTVYVIQASTGVISWTIHRRFQEFHSLQQNLQKAFPEIKFTKSLPSKKLLGTSISSQLVFDRRTQLEAYLRQFIDMKDVCRCKELQAFIKDQSVDVQDITLPYVMTQGLDYSLKLLSSAFGRGILREYATARWDTESDEVLLSYLLQLVQALRFEDPATPSQFPTMLIKRGVNNPLLGNFLHWHLMVEKDSKYPIFTKVHEQFKAESLRSEQGLDVLKMLMGQNELMNFLSGATVMLMSTNKIRQKKIKKLKKMFNPNEFMHKLSSFPPLRFPLDPHILATGIIKDTAYLFKSNLAPMLLQFTTTTPDELYTIIFKKGDDLRQDQLITQMVALMDNLLQKAGLDLKLTPYKVLATSRDEGLVEHIPSVPFAAALEEGNFDLQRYFAMKCPDPEGEYGFPDEVLDNFVRSSAGYCVITFLLGIGDRHLDNVLLTPCGKIFHIDFGYILDANPPMKFAPPMKLSKEMIDAMGGVSSKHYQKFIELSVSAYNELRRHSELITNLFILMADSGIKDIPHANDVIPKLQKKFRMDLPDEEASVFLQSMINESVSSVLPIMVESIHRWAQQRRN